MKISKLITLIIVSLVSMAMISGGHAKSFEKSTESTILTVIPNPVITEVVTPKPEFELLYDDVWGTIYHAEKRQCDDSPTITGDRSRINPHKASQHRWVAISQEMLDNDYRKSKLVYDRTNLYKGKIKYGDTIWIESPYKEINGWWVARDAKNSRYTKSIDFLQTKGDKSLYNGDKLWSGKFENVKIYKKSI